MLTALQQITFISPPAARKFQINRKNPGEL